MFLILYEFLLNYLLSLLITELDIKSKEYSIEFSGESSSIANMEYLRESRQ